MGRVVEKVKASLKVLQLRRWVISQGENFSNTFWHVDVGSKLTDVDSAIPI